MTEINQIILKLINENKNMKEISNVLNITEKQLYIRIKQLINKGFMLTPSYSYNSNIYYKLEKDLNKPHENKIDIKISSSEKEFRCLVISDLHIGHIGGDIRLAYNLYEYASKNNINIILFCGDMIEGDYTTDRKNIKDIYTQIETFIKKFPYDKNIILMGILGNHEYHYLSYGLDIMKWITTARYDIIPIGYGNGTVGVKNDSIYLKHWLPDSKEDDIKSKIVIQGHGHMMKSKVYDKVYLCAPTLSYKSPDATKELIPGFIDLTLSLEKGRFEFVDSHHIALTPNLIEMDNFKCKIKTLFKDNNGR